MTRLRREGARVVREDGWPASRDVGREWRWSIEFYNRR